MGSEMCIRDRVLAGFALQPGLRAAGHIARQEIAAGLAVLGIGGGDRSDGAARARARIFPRLAGVLAAAYTQDGQTCRDFLASYVTGSSQAWLQGEACKHPKGVWEVRTLKPWKRS